MLADVDGPLLLLGELLHQQVVSYFIALWSSVAAITSWYWPWDLHLYYNDFVIKKKKTLLGMLGDFC